MDEHKRNLAIPLGTLLACFIIILISLNGIIQMAKPSNKFRNSEQSQNIGYATAIINNPNIVSYQTLKTTSSANFLNSTGINNKLSGTRVKDLTPEEQDKIIKSNLLKWKISQLEIQVEALSQSDSLIFRLWFWVLTFFLWVGSTVFGRVLLFVTDEYITPKLKKKG